MERLRQGEDARLIELIDGKPLPVGGASHDAEVRCGRGAGMWAKGYKFYAIWGSRPVPETYGVYTMNINEDKVGEEMITELHGGGYLLGDGEYDANSVFDAAGARAISAGAAGGPGYGVGAPLPERVSAAVHRADAIGLRQRGVRLPGCDRADLWCSDVVWRRVVAASVVGAAPEPGLAVGQCSNSRPATFALKTCLF